MSTNKKKKVSSQQTKNILPLPATSNVSVPTTSSMPVISSTIPNVSIIPSVTHNTPVTPFTDFTNLHMLLQQHYPSAQLFNSLVLNKTNNESEEVYN